MEDIKQVDIFSQIKKNAAIIRFKFDCRDRILDILEEQKTDITNINKLDICLSQAVNDNNCIDRMKKKIIDTF